jgi:hypothetical protein
VTASSRLEIVIDELVFRGLSPAEAHVAAAALEARLTALAGRPDVDVPARAEAFRRLPTVEANSTAGVGEAAAAAVWSGLTGGGRT